MRVFAVFPKPHPVEQLALSADGRLAAVAGGGVVVLCGLIDARPVWGGDFLPPAQLAFSPDGVWVAAGYPTGLRARRTDRTEVWEDVWSGLQYGGGIAFDPDGRHLLATVSVPPSAYSYDPRPRGRLDRWTVPGWRHIPGPEIATAFDRLAVSPDGDLFAGINADGFELRYTNSGGLSARHDSFRQLARRFGSAAPVRSPAARFVSFAPDGESVVFGWDEDLRVADARTGREVRRFPRPDRPFLDAAFTGSGHHLGTADGTPVLKLWDAAAWQVAREYDWAAGSLTRVAFTADGLAGVCGTADGRLVVFDLDE